MEAPIIFIHYNDSYYLKHTLRSAVLFNPDKEVILLGDENNRYHQKLGLTFYHLNEFANGPEIELFDKIYRFIAGEQHSRHEWTRFVFRRWFIIYNFLLAKGIQRFWTFDSDNLVLTRLSGHEEKFKEYDCTEQCSGICMNGFVNGLNVVKGYVDKMNELFQRPRFIQQQQASLKNFPRYAFTEMRAYVAYRDECPIKHIRLNTIINSETFLDSICTTEEHRLYFNEDEYEVYSEKLWKLHLKKIYLRSDGHIFLWHLPSGQLVKMNTINMSWTPGWLIGKLLKHARRRLRPNMVKWFIKLKLKTGVLDFKKIAAHDQ